MDPFELIHRGLNAVSPYVDESVSIFVVVALSLLVSLALINQRR